MDVSMPMQAIMVGGQATTPPSFAEAYRNYAQRTARWAYNLGSSDIDVEDVVQEVFLVVSRKLASYSAEGSFTSWLFEITRKVVANHRRRESWRFWRKGDQEGLEEELENVPSHGLDPAAELDRRRLAVLFYHALDQLPEKYRTVFVLYEIEDMSVLSISELCRLNLSTVKVQLARARQRFISSYQKLLRKKAGTEGTSLLDIAERTVVPSPAVLVRVGKGKS
jgi:RNA polymerase sigma-70 factor (ECF subfamily)